MDELAALRAPPRHARILERTGELGFTMGSDLLTGSLLRTLAASRPAAAILELGTGTGLGTCWLLDGMDARSTLTSIDSDSRAHAIARDELGGDARLELLLVDGGEYLESCSRRFDLIFADTWPGKYTHFEAALRLLPLGGMYVVDDMLPQPSWPEGHAPKVAGLIQTLERHPDLVVTKLAWSSGVILCVKRSAS